MTATPGGTATPTPVPTTMCAAFQATAERMPDVVAPALVELAIKTHNPMVAQAVTPTMKVRRRPVPRAYADRIDALYAEQ